MTHIQIGLIIALLALASLMIYDYTNTKAKLREAEATVDILNSRIEMQNAAIKEHKKISDAKIAAGERALAQAKKQTTIKTETAKVIYETLPAVPNDACASALILGNTK